MRKLLALILLALIPLSAAVAQSNSQWYVGKPIKNIVFTGLVHVKRSELEGIIKPFIGKKFTDTLFFDLQSKLYALDYFSQFTPNAEPGNPQKTSVIINFHVIERPIVSSIDIKGNNHIRNSEILKAITLKKDDIVNRIKLKNDTDAIVNLYKKHGFANAKVTYTINENDKAKTAVVTFHVDEGGQTKVKKVLFQGNTFASDGTLKRLLKTKEQSLFSSGVFEESNLAQDKSAIIKYYQDHGFEDVQVPDISKKSEVDKKTNTVYLTLTYHIKEGPQYTYGGTTFSGNTLFSSKKLADQIGLQKGQILDKSKLQSGFGKIHDLYLNDGYIFNTFDTKAHKNDQTHVISYDMKITERGRAHIENIIIKGNTKTKDYVIKREIPLQVGDVFSKQKVVDGLRNLYNTQYFNSVTPQIEPGSVNGLMDLIFNVEPAKTTDLNFGLSVSGAQSGFPILGFLKLSDKNFMGLGEDVNVQTQLSSTQQSLNFGFQDNWLFGRRWSNGINLTIAHYLQTDQPQDITPPVFTNQNNAVPDPYDGHYVFSTTETYNGTTYQPGQYFPGYPTQAQINDYNLVTDYAYAQSQGETIPTSYLMSYHEIDLSLSYNTGYSWHTGLGIFNVGTSISPTLTYITYDPTVNRPFSETVRNNLNQWNFVNKWNLSASWDTRNLAYNPSSGFYLKQSVLFAGGFLGGVRDYIQTTSRADYYKTLFDIPVTDNWHFKTVFGIRSSLSLIFPQFNGVFNATTSDLLYIDGITIARGWNRRTDGRALWNNMAELKIPLVQKYLWWEFFLSGTVMYPEPADLKSMSLNDFLFSTGGGVRLTVPGLPIGLYLVKRFKVNNNAIQWEQGNTGLLGLDFVIAFNTQIF